MGGKLIFEYERREFADFDAWCVSFAPDAVGGR
jgi:hypothetical protein